MLSTENADWNGRYCNRLLVNLGYSEIARVQNIYVEYNTDFEELGLQLYKPPKPAQPSSPQHSYCIDRNNYLELMERPIHNAQNHVFKRYGHFYFQTHEFAEYFYNHIRRRNDQERIESKNPYAARYAANHDVFVHVRLGDISQESPGYDYYAKALSVIPYDKGYISTDSPNHPMIQRLQTTFGLERILYSEAETIQFASTCMFLVLSHGTFSWACGIFAFNASQVYYPKINKPFFIGVQDRPWNAFHWHGDIFRMPRWMELT